jgi:hypothetical protein
MDEGPVMGQLAIPLTLALSLQKRRSQMGGSGGRHSEVSLVSGTKEPRICPHNVRSGWITSIMIGRR